MGQRTKNRILEHSGPGHNLKKSATNHAGGLVVMKSKDYHKQFWKCTCGWEGWLTRDLNAPE